MTAPKTGKNISFINYILIKIQLNLQDGCHLGDNSHFISFFNERAPAGSVALQTRRYADRVIVEDDGSSGRTAEVAELPGGEVIRHPEDRGKGAPLG